MTLRTDTLLNTDVGSGGSILQRRGPLQGERERNRKAFPWRPVGGRVWSVYMKTGVLDPGEGGGVEGQCSTAVTSPGTWKLQGAHQTGHSQRQQVLQGFAARDGQSKKFLKHGVHGRRKS